MDDLTRARAGDQSEKLGDKLEAAWRREQDAARRHGGKPSLTKALVRTFWLEYMMLGFGVGILFIVLWYEFLLRLKFPCLI